MRYLKIVILMAGAILIADSEMVSSQDLAAPDTLQGWDLGWVVNINGSQASYSNWAKGGVNNISATGTSQLTALYKQNRFSYGFRLRTRYGKSKIQDEGVRKTDDRLIVRNRFLYDIGDEDVDFKFFGNINFGTQFDKGFDYGAGPDGENILISNFLAPAYFTQNAGIAYVPVPSFSAEAGLGMKQTIVRDTDLSESYGLDPGEQLFNEAGLTFALNYEREIFQNVFYTGYFGTFSNLNRSLSRTDVIFSNELVGQINSYMNASLQFEMIYDDDFSDEIQVSQVLSVGISFRLR